MKNKVLAKLFAVFACVAAFGIGNMVQANSIADAVNTSFGIDHWMTGIIIFAFTFTVIMGGIKSIGRTASAIVPVMIILYIAGSAVILAIYWQQIPDAFILIFKNAFSAPAAVGGFAGATVKEAIRMGVARGIFSNESGLGSSPIAAAAAKTDEPVKQALVSMTQTFIDTIVVCTMTGLVIIVTDVWKSGKTAAPLTEHAFTTGLPGMWGGIIVTLSLVFFAYSTILGWSYYGEKCIEYLAGERAIVPYRVLWVIFVFFGSIAKIELIWTAADIMNGLMAFPNLVALLALSGVVVAETRRYFTERQL